MRTGRRPNRPNDTGHTTRDTGAYARSCMTFAGVMQAGGGEEGGGFGMPGA